METDAHLCVKIDACECFYMEMCGGVLQTFLGYGARLEFIKEVSQLRVQMKGEGKRKFRRNPHWNAKRKAEKKSKWDGNVELSEERKSKVKRLVDDEDG